VLDLYTASGNDARLDGGFLDEHVERTSLGFVDSRRDVAVVVRGNVDRLGDGRGLPDYRP